MTGVSLACTAIYHAGDDRHEQLVFTPIDDISLGKYIVFYNNSAGDSEWFWFPDLQLSSDQRVILYTRESFEEGHPQYIRQGNAHLLSWRLGAAIWKKHGAKLFIIKADDWRVSYMQ